MPRMRPQVLQRQADEALRIVRSISAAVAEGRAADQELAAHFRTHRHFGSRDRRFFSAVIFAYFRWKGWVDAIAELPQALAAACWLSREAHHPPLACWAQLPAELPSTATLTDKAAALAAWQTLSRAPTPSELFPVWFSEEVLSGAEPESAARIAASFQERPPLWLRARVGHTPTISRLLNAAGFACTPDPRIPTAIRVEGSPSAEALRPILHRHAEIQDIASQLVGTTCAPRAGEQWWDVCAGAGGKTLHLLDLLGDSGFVCSSDVRSSALRELTRRIHAANFTRVATQVLSENPENWQIAEQFDGILIDAPCSGIGTWGRAPDARWRVARKDLLTHQSRQLAILNRASRQLKAGGRLIYAVCSLSQLETEQVIATFLKQSPDFSLNDGAPLAIYPDFGPGIGMWIASLRKT